MRYNCRCHALSCIIVYYRAVVQQDVKDDGGY